MTVGRKEGEFGNGKLFSLIGVLSMKGRLTGGEAENVGGGQSVDLEIRGEKKIVEDFERYSFSHEVVEVFLPSHRKHCA